jgi:PKD repeat protein
VHAFPRNGVYQIQLELVDNENNKITEKYNLSVSDPVAFIKFSPDEGTTSDTYSFDASASYSLTSRVKTYQWEVTDPTGAKIDVLETKQLKRKFSSPGIYTVKLTVVDEL